MPLAFKRLHLLPALTGLAGLVLAVTVFLTLIDQERINQQDRRDALARETLGNIAGTISNRAKALERMALRWEVALGTHEELWRADAMRYLADMPELQSLSWSDSNLVIRWFSGRGWQENRIGFDFRRLPDRHADLMITRSTGQPRSSGPTVQHGVHHGFTYDIPLSYKDGASAGYLHAEFDYVKLLMSASRHLSADYDVQLQVNGRRILSPEGAAEAADGARGLAQASLLNEDWQLALYQRSGGLTASQVVFPALLSVMIFALGVVTAVALLFRGTAFKRARQQVAAHRRLQVAINALESPFAFFDSDDRLQNWNQAYTEMNAGLGETIVRNDTYEDILRKVVSRGLVPVPEGREEFFIQQRMALHALPTFTVEREMSDGRWIKTVEKRTSDGGTATLWIDITEQKARQSELERLNEELTVRHAELEAARTRLKAEEARFRIFAEASADWFWESDENHCLTWISENVESLGHHPREWYIGKSRIEMGQPSEPDAAWDAHLEDLAARRPYRDFTVHHSDEDGEVWIRSAGVPQFEEDGTFTGYMGTGTNVSALKLAERNYNDIQEQLSMAVSTISEGLVIFSPDDKVVLCNDNWLERNPWSAEDVKNGLDFYDMLQMSRDRGLPEHLTSDQLDARYHDRTTMRDRPEIEMMEFETRDGLWCRVTDTRTANGGTVSIRTDITDLKQRQKELEVQRNSAEEANRAKTDFLTNMSHELRTPLNAIIGFSDIMVTGIFGELPDRYRSYATDISSSGKHLLSLINDLLDSAKIESGTFELEMEQFTLESLIRQSVVLINPLAEERGIHVQVDGLLDETELTADQRALRQILVNLLSNAVKFSPMDGRIDLLVSVTDNSLRISVKDQGIGIDEEDLRRVFERFVQVQDPMSRTHAGTGIGLPLSRSLAEMHGGTLHLESEVGSGTTAILYLPDAVITEAEVPVKEAV